MMRPFLAILRLTLRESFARRTFQAFLAISSIVALLFLFALNLDIVDGMQSAISLFGFELEQQVNLSRFVTQMEGAITILLFSGGIFMSLFATSSLIPSLLQPGIIDLYIAKPVSRPLILTARWLGGILIVVINISYLILSTWLIISLKSGIWNSGYLLALFPILLAFTALFTFMTFVGLISANGPLSLMLTYAIIFFSPLLMQRDEIYALLSAKIYSYLLDGLYYILPKMAEMGALSMKLTLHNEITDGWVLFHAAGFVLVLGLINLVIFQRKNF